MCLTLAVSALGLLTDRHLCPRPGMAVRPQTALAASPAAQRSTGRALRPGDPAVPPRYRRYRHSASASAACDWRPSRFRTYHCCHNGPTTPWRPGAASRPLPVAGPPAVSWEQRHRGQCGGVGGSGGGPFQYAQLNWWRCRRTRRRRRRCATRFRSKTCSGQHRTQPGGAAQAAAAAGACVRAFAGYSGRRSRRGRSSGGSGDAWRKRGREERRRWWSVHSAAGVQLRGLPWGVACSGAGRWRGEGGRRRCGWGSCSGGGGGGGPDRAWPQRRPWRGWWWSVGAGCRA